MIDAGRPVLSIFRRVDNRGEERADDAAEEKPGQQEREPIVADERDHDRAGAGTTPANTGSGW